MWWLKVMSALFLGMELLTTVFMFQESVWAGLGWAVIVLGGLGSLYLYGCHVGMEAGDKAGRKKADAEWANMLENGAL